MFPPGEIYISLGSTTRFVMRKVPNLNFSSSAKRLQGSGVDLSLGPVSRTQWTTFLDYAPGTAPAKCEGMSSQDTRNAPLPRLLLMTLGGWSGI